MQQIQNGLYIGDMTDLSPLEDPEVPPDEFTYVVSLGTNETPYTTETCPITVNPTPWKKFFEAVDIARQAMRTEDEMIFIHCNVGKNRINAVVATAIAAEENGDLKTAVEYLRTKRTVDISEELRDLGEKYLRLDENRSLDEWDFDGHLEMEEEV